MIEERDEQINNLREHIDSILECKTGVRRKNITKKDFNKFVFVNIIDNIEFLIYREEELEDQFGFKMEDYNLPFFNVIDMLLEMNFTKDELDVINFYLYGRIDQEGNTNSLMNETTGDILIIDNADDLWNVLQDIKKK